MYTYTFGKWQPISAGDGEFAVNLEWGVGNKIIMAGFEESPSLVLGVPGTCQLLLYTALPEPYEQLWYGTFDYFAITLIGGDDERTEEVLIFDYQSLLQYMREVQPLLELSHRVTEYDREHGINQ